MRKANFCYDQSKNRREGTPSWRNKKPSTFEQRKGGFKPNKNFNNKNFQKGSHQGNNFRNHSQQGYTTARTKETPKGNGIREGV